MLCMAKQCDTLINLRGMAVKTGDPDPMTTIEQTDKRTLFTIQRRRVSRYRRFRSVGCRGITLPCIAFCSVKRCPCCKSGRDGFVDDDMAVQVGWQPRWRRMCVSEQCRHSPWCDCEGRHRTMDCLSCSWHTDRGEGLVPLLPDAS